MEYQQHDIDAMLKTACDAARAAGQMAVDLRHKADVSIKAGRELVTTADTACQELIIKRIKATFPDHGIIAEEGPQGRLLKLTPEEGQQIWWAIDPIDGTQNFAKGIPIFSCSIAALFRGSPIVAAVYDPCMDLMFSTAIDRPAFCNDAQIHASDEPLGPFVSVGVDSHLGQQLPGWIGPILLGTRFRNLGSAALHLAYVAKSGMVATILCMTKLWDIAAGTLLAQQAGAIVSNWKGGPVWPIDPRTYDGQPIPCLAAGHTCHKELTTLLNS